MLHLRLHNNNCGLLLSPDSVQQAWPFLHVADFHMADQRRLARRHFPHVQVMHRQHAADLFQVFADQQVVNAMRHVLYQEVVGLAHHAEAIDRGEIDLTWRQAI